MSTNNPMTQEELDAIQERLDARTPGTWDWDDETGTLIAQDGDDFAPVLAYGNSWQEDRDLIAHAPQDMADLLAEVERLRARLTVDDAMVKRGAFALARRRAEDPLARDRVVGHTLLVDAKAVLDAALGTGEGA